MTSEKLQPFNAKPKCPKCHQRDISRRFHDGLEGVYCGSYDNPHYHRPLEREHFIMYCRTCTYQWREECAKPRRKRK